jgi:hypothetical protein
MVKRLGTKRGKRQAGRQAVLLNHKKKRLQRKMERVLEFQLLVQGGVRAVA